MEKIKQMEEQLASIIQTQLCNPEHVDSKELGEVVDMLKDLSEFCYYKTITEAMEQKEKEPKSEYHMYYPSMDYYRDMDRDYGKMYYSNGDGSHSYPSNGRGNNGSSSSYYTDQMMMMPEHDYREGRSYRSRRNYMESKEMHQGKEVQMQELEKYMRELSQDITEMIQDASPEERTVLQQKLQTLATKVAK